jgi:transcriptional regulator with XRE-family HTH domain
MVDPVSDWIGSISDLIADQIRDLRRREGLTREELAAAARGQGLPATFTAVALGNVETGRRDHEGRRRREVTVDELAALAAAAGRSPLDLLGAAGELFGAERAECGRCASGRGELERTIRGDVEQLGELTGVQRSLAQTAFVLAAAIDAGGGDQLGKLPQLAKELRATLEHLAAGSPGEHDPDDDEDELGDLDQPE